MLTPSSVMAIELCGRPFTIESRLPLAVWTPGRKVTNSSVLRDPTGRFAIWFVVTFVEAWFARELNSVSFLGFPLGFYMSAQGSLIVYVVLIGVYAWYMNKLDKEYQVDEGDE